MGKLVWLASYPKSGNTWLRVFLHNFLLQPEAPHSINALTDISAVECAAVFFGGLGTALASSRDVQKSRPAVHQRLTELHSGPVFVKTHNANLTSHDVPLCTPAVTAGAIYVVRDPRDVAVSYSAYTGRSIDEIIDFMADPRAAIRATDMQVFELLSSWSAHALSWVGAKNRLLLRYEDLLANPEAAFGRVARFLGNGAAPERLQRAIIFSDFSVLASQERESGYRAHSAAAQTAFFRAGTSGQWRDVLTSAQAQKIAAAHGEVMRNFGYLDGLKPA
jgi:Sulfotransferase domain